MIESETFQLKKGEKFIALKLLNNLITETDIKTAIIEEKNSELWFETLHGFGKVFFTNNIRYNGNIKYGLLESNLNPNTTEEEQISTITFPDGTKYIGTVHNNQITGKGIYYFPEGSEYTGDVFNGFRHGYGKYNSNTGVIYEGEWLQGLKHGKGKIIQGNMILEGKWSNGIIDGQGKIKWKNGNTYEGDIHDNKMHGNGYMVWYDYNEKYIGQWNDNSQAGLGVFIWYEPKGDLKQLRNRYVGEWVNGIRNGFGLFYYSNGSYYEGYWKNDMKEGYGVFTDVDRRKNAGYYKEDMRIENNFPTKHNSKKKPSFISNIAGSTIGKLTKSFLRKNSLNQTAANNNTSNILSISMTSKGLEVIKETEEAKNNKLASILGNNSNTQIESIPEETHQVQVKTTEIEMSNISIGLQNRINQSLNEIKLYIDISDLITIDNLIKESLKEIDNILLRNLTFFSRIYLKALGRESDRDYDLGTSTISKSQVNETKSQFLIPITNKIEEKKESKIEYDCIYNDDLYFCLDLQLIWKFLREVGLITPELSIAMFNRIFFLTSKNYIEMFYLPNSLAKEGNKEYDSLYQMIKKRKQVFNAVNKTLIERSYLLLYQDPNYEDYINANNQLNKDNENEIKITSSPNIHDYRHIILHKHFYEVFIRIAYLKLFTIPTTLDQKLKQLIDIIKVHFKSKRKTLEHSVSIQAVCDLKSKSIEPSEEYKLKFQMILSMLFKEIYLLTTAKPKLYDMTIKVSFLYKLFNSDSELKQIIKDKTDFAEIITFHNKDKVVFNQNTVKFMNPYDIYKYLNCVFESELIVYEFIEIVFVISKKYFVFYNTEEEDFKNVIEIISNCIKEVKEKERRNNKQNVYFYPRLQAHCKIEKLQKEENQRKVEEQKRKEEVLRYSKERKALLGEDINHYEEKEVIDSDSSDY